MTQSKTELVYRCACSGYHYFELNKGDGAVFVTFVERPKSFRQRLHALKAVFTGETVYHGELYIDDFKKFQKEVGKL